MFLWGGQWWGSVPVCSSVTTQTDRQSFCQHLSISARLWLCWPDVQYSVLSSCSTHSRYCTKSFLSPADWKGRPSWWAWWGPRPRWGGRPRPRGGGRVGRRGAWGPGRRSILAQFRAPWLTVVVTDVVTAVVTAVVTVVVTVVVSVVVWSLQSQHWLG